VAAAHGVLKHFVPANAAALDAARSESLAANDDSPAAKASGIAVGEAAAAALIAHRLDDGAAPRETFLPDSAARQVVATRHRSVAETARFFALLNMAISDGLVSSMETKYFYQFWRPVTAIVNGAEDGNPRTDADTSWLPLVTTPAFPSYPSAHASASYAAREVAERFLGSHQIRFELSHPGVSGVVLSYESFRDLTDDIDDARVFGGIHFRFDQEAGAIQGRKVGAYVATHNLLRLGKR
jgi:hypothetical protein